MDALTLLVGSVLSWLRSAVGLPVCPGGWAWATTAFGVLVGLLPSLGAGAVALARRRLGASYPRGGFAVPVVGMLSCGVLPWMLFQATGAVFRAARFAGGGLSAADRSSLATDTCLGLSQRAYLGSASVSAALGSADPFAVLLFVPLVVLPLVVALLVWGQSRAALRQGPRWPRRFFWLPVLVLALLTGPMPAGATAQLWLGVFAGALAGVFVVPHVPPPAPTRARPATAVPRAGPTPPLSGSAKAPVRLSGARPAPDLGARAREWAERAQVAARPLAGQLAELAARARAEAEAGWRKVLSAPSQQHAPRSGTTGSPSVPPAGRSGPAAPGASAPLAAEPGPVPAPQARGGTGSAAVPRPRTPTVPGPARRFELIRQLGVGGFGGVFLAVDHRHGRQVAIKAAHAPDRETELRIRREARALATVRHPHCVRILDLVDSRSDPGLAGLRGLVIVMEYVAGQPLAELVMSRGPVDDVCAARIWLRTAGALAAAHQQGVLHRDVKPSNVVLDPGGDPHLIDFGIARAPGDMTLTSTGMVIGTPDFLAPETARGDRATPSSDAWQLAATISFALTGTAPRGDHGDAVAGLRAAISLPPTHLPPRSAHRQLLAASLAADPAARPTLAEVQRLLEWWLAQVAGSGRPGVPGGPHHRATMIEKG